MIIKTRMFAQLQQPFPLSCLLHGVIILGVCMVIGNADWPYTDKPPAEVVMEVKPEELPERTVPQKASLNPFAKESVWENLAVPAKEPAAAETAAGEAGPKSPAKANSSGSAAVLSAADAAAGDGVVAAGAGSQAMTGGTTAVAANTNTGGDGSGAVGADGDAPAAPAESTASIASRFAARVEANKEYPYMAVKRGQSGVVSVTATLSAAGNLESSFVAASSGVSVLDSAALQAVRNSCPFNHGAGKSITMTVPIRFSLQ